jgi:hypothetical protein
MKSEKVDFPAPGDEPTTMMRRYRDRSLDMQDLQQHGIRWLLPSLRLYPTMIQQRALVHLPEIRRCTAKE